MQLPILTAATVLLLSFVPAFGQKGVQSPRPKAVQYDYCSNVTMPGKGGCKVGEDVAAETPLMEAIRQRDVASVRKLVAAGADVNEADGRGILPLLMVARGDFELIDILVKAGADVNKATGYGTTALHNATQCSAAVRRFLEAGADPNVRDFNRHTPLMDAAAYQNLESVKLLVKAGADVTAVDVQGMTPFLYAFQTGNSELIRYFTTEFDEKLILNEKVLTKAMHFALLSSKIDQVRYLLSKRASVAGAETIDLPLGIAVQQDNPEMVKLLLDHGAKVNRDDGFSPIYWAAYTGHARNVKLLLEAGADVDEPRYSNNWTPLIAAARLGHVESVKLLLDAGAKIDRTGSDGLTALAYAAWEGRYNAAKLLIERGADVNIKNDRDWSALVLAKGNKRDKIVTLLTENGARESIENR